MSIRCDAFVLDAWVPVAVRSTVTDPDSAEVRVPRAVASFPLTTDQPFSPTPSPPTRSYLHAETGLRSIQPSIE